MTIYVETNFILEIAFLQQDHERCQQIIDWASDDLLSLALPAFCIGEPYGTWTRRAKRRRRMLEQFNREMREMARSEPYAALRSHSNDVTQALVQSIEQEKSRLDQLLGDLMDVVELITLDETVFRAALHYQDAPGLPPQDALVYASVISHLRSNDAEQRYFLNKNADDFANPDIVEELEVYGCRLFTHFGEGFGTIRAQALSGD